MADLSDIATKIRRTLRRHRRWTVALCAALAVFSFTRALAPPAPPTTSVAVAARDLPAGQVLGPDDVRVVELPRGMAPAGVAASAEALVDRTLASPIRKGEPISDRRVVGDALVAGYAAGLVATPVRINDADVVSLLRVGDHIDVYAAVSDDVDDARRVVTDAAVVTLPQVAEESRDGALVVLAVTPGDAASLAQGSAAGPLSISLRG